MKKADCTFKIRNSIVSQLRISRAAHGLILLSVFALELHTYSFAQPLKFASATSIYVAHTSSNQLRFRVPKSEFVSFEAAINGDHVALYWTMTPSPHLTSITVERSTNKRNFLNILTMDTSGGAKRSITYCEIDNKPVRKVAYYRLKATDKYGSCIYSRVAVIKVGKTKSMFSEPTWFSRLLNKNSTRSILADFDLSREIFIVARDNHGNEHHAKLVITGFDGTCYTAINRENKLAPGIYQVTGSEDYRLDHQKIKVGVMVLSNSN